MLSQISSSVKSLFISTGNILELNQLKIKAAQNPTDELTESLKITFAHWTPSSSSSEDVLEIKRDDLPVMPKDDRNDLKVTVKIFISSMDRTLLNEAIFSVFQTLDTGCIDSLVLAHPNKLEFNTLLEKLKDLWQVLEKYVENGKVGSIGVSDVETDLFIALHSWAKVKPTIIQVNLATCCVVPPALQDFTKANDIQLLTHSDPFEILPKTALNEVFGPGSENQVGLHWAARFQVHVKCRGVLVSKGYLVCLQRINQ